MEGSQRVEDSVQRKKAVISLKFLVHSRISTLNMGEINNESNVNSYK
jgi:hypothetical protein